MDFSKFVIETFLSPYGFATGPAWSPETYLVFSDVPAERVIKVSPKGTTELRNHSGGASGNAFDKRGRLYSCETHTRQVTRTDDKGKVEVLADRFDGKRFNAPNDLVVAGNGHIFFTDPAFGKQQDERELAFYGVFCVLSKSDVRLAVEMKTRPNGIALSPDGKRLYVSDADDRKVRVHDVGKDGALSPGRIMPLKFEGIPSGLHCDGEGRVFLNARGIYIYSPEGASIGEIPFRETPNGCTFADDEFKTMYVTTRNTVYRVRFGESLGDRN